MEVWKDIPNYAGLYEASNMGNVRTKEGKETYTNYHGKRKWKSRMLKQKNTTSREIRFDLWKDGKPKTFLAHRLVAKAFILNPENKKCINHKDGNPRNNKLNNLEWATYKENQNHAFDNDLAKTNMKIKLINLKNGNEQSFRSMSYASLYLGRSKGYISSVLIKGKNKIHGYEIVRL